MINCSRNVLCEILSFLTFKEICVVSSTCKYLNNICESDNLWQSSNDIGSGSQRKSTFCRRYITTNNIFKKVSQVNVLKGHVRTINSVSVKGNKILSCSEDHTVRLWNTKKLKGNKIIDHIDNAIAAEFWDKGVVSVSADRTLRVLGC